MRKLLLAILLSLYLSPLSAEELEVHFVNMGQGDCTLIQTPNGRNILVDCGTTGGGDKYEVRDYLRDELGDSGKIDVLVLTHPDKDHYNLIPFCLAGVQVDKILLTDADVEYDESHVDEWLDGFPADRKVLLDKNHFDPVGTPSDLFGAGETKLHVLASNIVATDSPANARSIVMMVTLNEFDVMLTGDGTTDTQAKIIQRYDNTWLDVDVLKIGHHGSLATSEDPETWANIVKPEVAVVSCSYSNTYGHPRKELLDFFHPHTLNEATGHKFRWAFDPDGPGGQPRRTENVNDYKEAIYTTARNGNVVVSTDGTSYSVKFAGAVTDSFDP